MSSNHNALIRYRILDECLQNRSRKWTLDDLIESCSDALYAYAKIDKRISRRTLQGDLQLMRSNKIGYNAPIVVEKKKYYTYSDPDYKISNVPLSQTDLDVLRDVTHMLRQFKSFSHFKEAGDIVNRLENKLQSGTKQNSGFIHFESSSNLNGLNHFEKLYESIVNQKTQTIIYKSFNAKSKSNIIFFPYLLKEYRNSWFILGRKKTDKQITILALDRIISTENKSIKYQAKKGIDFESYFDEIIGVTNPSVRAQKVEFFINKNNAPYLLTKPLHPTQKIIEENEKGAILEIKVKMNFELERELLGFGEGIVVIKPKWLKRRIEERLGLGYRNYMRADFS